MYQKLFTVILIVSAPIWLVKGVEVYNLRNKIVIITLFLT